MDQLRKFIQKPFIMKLLTGLFSFLIIIGLRYNGYLEMLELSAYDWFIRAAPKLSERDSRITLIEISEKDIQAIGWPLTDSIIAVTMEALLKNNPRAIGLDMYRDIPVPPGSGELNTIFAEHPLIIGVMKFGDKGVQAPAIIRDTDQVGFNDILVDPGGVVRRALLFLDNGQKTYTSFALRLVSLYIEAEEYTLQPDPENPKYLRLRNTTIKPLEANDGGYANTDARGYQFLLDFQGADMPFKSYSLSNLLSGEIPKEAIADKIILIGVSTQSVKDFFYTPLSRGFLEIQQITGVALHGHIISQLLRLALDGASPIKTATGMQSIIWTLIWSIVGGLIGLRIRSVWRFSTMIISGLMILFIVAYLAFLARWWIPLVPPSLSFFMSAVVVTAYISNQEKKERALLMQLFSKHVSKEIAEIIWDQKDQFLNDGRPRSQKMTATIFFSDLRDFTTMSEKMAPQDLIDWLNAYMEPLTSLIMKHGGVIDDYAGDSIKANFGVPIARKNENEIRRDAMNAVTCALAIDKEMHLLNTHWIERGLPAMRTRIGICTGPVVAGALGSAKRLKYTTVGDTVNIAARLESYDKEVGKDALCRIIISEKTLYYINSQFKMERIGEVSLKGKDEKITIYRVLGESTSGLLATS